MTGTRTGNDGRVDTSAGKKRNDFETFRIPRSLSKLGLSACSNSRLIHEHGTAKHIARRVKVTFLKGIFSPGRVDNKPRKKTSQNEHKECALYREIKWRRLDKACCRRRTQNKSEKKFSYRFHLLLLHKSAFFISFFFILCGQTSHSQNKVIVGFCDDSRAPVFLIL